MENPTPFDLNTAIRRWQQDLAASPAVCADNLEELASHLRASVQLLKATGLSEAEAFLVASRRMGAVDELGREFGKLNRDLVWGVQAFWMLAGMLIFLGAYDFSNLISSAIMTLCSHFFASGSVLGWIGVATWFSLIVLVAFIFHLLATGRLIGITTSTARLLRRRKTAVAVLFCGAVALRVAGAVGMLFLYKNLTPTTLSKVIGIRAYCQYIGFLPVIMLILVALTKPASETSKIAD